MVHKSIIPQWGTKVTNKSFRVRNAENLCIKNYHHSFSRTRKVSPESSLYFCICTPSGVSICKAYCKCNSHKTDQHFVFSFKRSLQQRYWHPTSCEAARNSISSVTPAKSLKLKHTIKLIGELDDEISEIEAAIKQIVDSLGTTILTIPGIGYATAASILAEVGDFSNFETPDKILAFAGMSPSTYQSGQLSNCYAHMEKRGSKYLRFALYNATKYVCKWDSNFAAYLAKKRSEGKHYNVAISHAAKKLVRLIFALEKSRLPYMPVA